MSATVKKLFDVVLVVELQEEADGAVNPFISYRFPQLFEKDPFSASVTQFCFPDKEEFPTERMQSEVFSFVLTEADGDKRFGYCLRKLPGGSGPRYPVAYSMMSLFPCYPLYTKILERVAYHYENSSGKDLTKFLESVLANRFPKPGESFSVKAEMGGKLESWRITRPDEDGCQLEYINFDSFLELMEPLNILSTFISLLVERRIIFVANSLPVLSSSVQAAVAFLYPFNWQHIFIPVLPTSLLSFCCAPMPFVVGILRTSLDEVLQLPMDEVLIVDIDNNCFLSVPEGNDLELLPQNYWLPLKNVLHSTRKDIKRSKKKRKKNVDAKLEASCQEYEAKQAAMKLSEIFLEFFMYMFSDWKEFVDGKDFDRQQFVDSCEPEIVDFMNMMCGSQMFERFVQERIMDDDAVYGTFDKRVESNEPFGQFLTPAQLFGSDFEQPPTSLEEVFGKGARVSMRPGGAKTKGMFQTLRKLGGRSREDGGGGGSWIGEDASPPSAISSPTLISTTSSSAAVAAGVPATPPMPPPHLAIPPPFVVPKKQLPRPPAEDGGPAGAHGVPPRGRGVRGRGVRGRGVRGAPRGRGGRGGAALAAKKGLSTPALPVPSGNSPQRPTRRGIVSENFTKGPPALAEDHPVTNADKPRASTHAAPPRAFQAPPEAKKPPRPTGPPPPGKRRSVRQGSADGSGDGGDEQRPPARPPARGGRGGGPPSNPSSGSSPVPPPRSSQPPPPAGRSPVPPRAAAPPPGGAHPPPGTHPPPGVRGRGAPQRVLPPRPPSRS